MDAQSAKPVSVQFTTAPGTALAGSDFTATSGTLTFALGQTTRTILVRTLDDVPYEGAENFVVNLSNPTGATIADGQAVGTITDNDSVRVAATTINDGSAQRSRVTSLTVTFNSPVGFVGPVTGAFTLTRNGGDSVGFSASSQLVNGVTVVTLSTFAGVETQFGSLADGRYTLTALASQISAGGQPLDGNGDGNPGDDFVLIGTPANGLFRLFGDSDGNGSVTAVDFNAFRLSDGASSYIFDCNGDNEVNASDFAQFRLRFGLNV